MAYNIKIETFEGPFDLLLHLVEKSKVDIYDIPITKITDQYLEYIKQLKEIDLDVTSEFLLMAATLIEIKSKMLLPVNKNNDIATDEELDPRNDLVRRMLEYKKYKEISQQFKIREEYANKMFSKKKEEIIFESKENECLNDIDLGGLIDAFNKLIFRQKNSSKNQITNKNIRKIHRDVVTIEEKIDYILNLLEYTDKISFDELFSIETSRVELVTTFLAVLELMKIKKIVISQDICFSQILIIPYSNDIRGV